MESVLAHRRSLWVFHSDVAQLAMPGTLGARHTTAAYLPDGWTANW